MVFGVQNQGRNLEKGTFCNLTSPKLEFPTPKLDFSTPSMLPFLSPHAGGKILGVLALFLVVVWYAIYREDGYTQL